MILTWSDASLIRNGFPQLQPVRNQQEDLFASSSFQLPHNPLLWHPLQPPHHALFLVLTGTVVENRSVMDTSLSGVYKICMEIIVLGWEFNSWCKAHCVDELLSNSDPNNNSQCAELSNEELLVSYNGAEYWCWSFCVSGFVVLLSLCIIRHFLGYSLQLTRCRKHNYTMSTWRWKCASNQMKRNTKALKKWGFFRFINRRQILYNIIYYCII